MNGQPISMFDFQNNYFPIGIIAMESARELAKLIDEHLMSWYYEEHPDEDLDKRRDLGVYVDEPEEDGEEDTDGEFDD